jgi:hypothetical protein
VKWAIVRHGPVAYDPRMAEAATEEKLDEYINATVNGAINATGVEHVKEALQLIANAYGRPKSERCGSWRCGDI